MRYHVQFEINVSDDIPEQDVTDWSRYMVNDSAELSLENPLADKSFDPIFGTFKIRRVE
jgi:hypothetical protein